MANLQAPPTWKIPAACCTARASLYRLTLDSIKLSLLEAEPTNEKGRKFRDAMVARIDNALATQPKCESKDPNNAE